VQRPAGVVGVSILFFAVAAYLAVFAVVWFVNPNALPLSLGAPLLHGLELAGPYMFLIGAGVALIVGFGLLRLNNFARRAAILIAFAGMLMLIPKVSADTADFSTRFFVSGSALVIRMMIVWYLWQSWTAEKFH
jgi:hypothetical protein